MSDKPSLQALLEIYDSFVRQVSFARPDERIDFDQALASVIALVEMLGAT